MAPEKVMRGPRGGLYVVRGGTKRYVFSDLPAEVVTDVVARHLAPRDAARLATTARAYRGASANAGRRAGRSVGLAAKASKAVIDRFAAALYTVVGKLEKKRRAGVAEYDDAVDGAVDTEVVSGNLAFSVWPGGGVLGEEVGVSMSLGDLGHDRLPAVPGARGVSMFGLILWSGGVVSVGDLELQFQPPYDTAAYERIVARIVAAYAKNPVRY